MLSFMRSEALPDPSDVLDGKVAFEHDGSRLDRTFAILAGCTALVSPKEAKKRKERAAALWKLLDEVATAGAKDVIVMSAKSMIDAGLLAFDAAKPVLSKLHKVLEAAEVKS